jgi:NTE family protein
MLARKPVWFQSGPVDVAIRASIAIPGFFTPVVLDGRVLVDGSVVDPVPMAPLASVPADLTLAVMLSGERAIAARPVGAAVGTAAELDPHPKPDSAEGEDVEAKASAGQAGKARSTTAAAGRAPAAKGTDGDARSGRSGAELADAGGSGGVATDAELADPDKDSSGDRRFFGLLPTRDDDESEAAIAKAEAKAARAEAKSLDFGTMEVVNLSYEVMQDIVTRFRFAAFPPDVLVTIPKDACTVLDFHRAEELIALGRQLTEQALDAWAPSA